MAEVADVLIIGSGPAGLTAGLYTSRADLQTVMLAGNRWGGQLMLTTEVENYPGFPEGVFGQELMEKMRKQTERFGTKIIDENVTEVDFSKQPLVVKTASGEFQTKTVIIATGAETRWLKVPGEEKLIGKGVSSCAPCDAPFFKNKKVIVVGGGDAAMEEALVLTKFASEVTVVHRRGEFRASKIMQERVLKNEKITVMWNSEVVEMIGEEKLAGVKIADVNDGNKVMEMPVDGVFVAIGHVPSTKIFDGKVALDAKGFVKKVNDPKYNVVNEEGEVIGNKYKMMTSVPGVFVAGDVHDIMYKQAVTAAGFGCQAALEVEKWLAERGNE